MKVNPGILCLFVVLKDTNKKMYCIVMIIKYLMMNQLVQQQLMMLYLKIMAMMKKKKWMVILQKLQDKLTKMIKHFECVKFF